MCDDYYALINMLDLVTEEYTDGQTSVVTRILVCFADGHK